MTNKLFLILYFYTKIDWSFNFISLEWNNDHFYTKGKIFCLNIDQKNFEQKGFECKENFGEFVKMVLDIKIKFEYFERKNV